MIEILALRARTPRTIMILNIFSEQVSSSIGTVRSSRSYRVVEDLKYKKSLYLKVHVRFFKSPRRTLTVASLCRTSSSSSCSSILFSIASRSVHTRWCFRFLNVFLRNGEHHTSIVRTFFCFLRGVLQTKTDSAEFHPHPKRSVRSNH